MNGNNKIYGFGIGPIQTIKTVIGRDSQVRTAYSINHFDKLESGTVLQQVFSYWLAQRDGSFKNWNPRSHLPEATDNISTVSVDAPNPMKFVMNDHRLCVRTGLGRDWNGQTLDAKPEWLIHTTACAVEYLDCALSRQPMLHRIEQRVAGIERDYVRLLLPVPDEDDEIKTLYYASRRLKPIELLDFEQ